MYNEKLASLKTWQERALYFLLYHQTALDKAGNTLRDTAKELGISVSTLCNELKLGRALKDDLDIIKHIKTRNKALQILNRGSESLKVELKYSKLYLTGEVIKVLSINNYDFYYIKLTKPIQTEFLDIETLILPLHHVKVLRE